MEDKEKYFLRQKFLPDWSEEKIHNARALCLGMGGLGSTVSSGLCRLGVKRIYIVDFDVVDDHNLNRQVLYNINDVGLPKVTQAEKFLNSHHNITSEIISENVDAVKEFYKIVNMAKDVDIIFNMIDVGDYFDAAIQSLALSLNISYCQGGTFQNTLTVDYIKAGGDPCWLCLSELQQVDILDRLHPSKIQSLTDISFIPHDDHPTGQSNFMVANACSNYMLMCWSNDYLQRGKVPSRIIAYTNDFETLAWELPANPNCLFCSKPKDQS